MVAKKSSLSGQPQNTYSIARIDTVGANGASVKLWLVNVKRQGRLFARNFPDSVYGGTDSAWQMAVAYRDALLHLFPPLTQMEQRTKIRVNNKSGIPGVMAKYRDGKLTAWLATLEVSGVIHRGYFAVKEHGDAKAKELAIAARQEMLAQHPNRFVTVNAQATQGAEADFPQLLDVKRNGDEALPIDSHISEAAISRQLEALDAWFDALRPQFVHLRLSVYPVKATGCDSLFIAVGGGSVAGTLQRKSWMMGRRSYQEVLLLAWEYAQAVLISQMGTACWEEFQKRFKGAILANRPGQGVFIRYRYDPPGGVRLRNVPPAELMPMLKSFSAPVLAPSMPFVQ